MRSTHLLRIPAFALLICSSGTFANAQICTPSYSGGCSSGIGLNSIYFTGVTALTDLNTGCGGTNGYDDRTSTSVTVNPGSSYTVTFNTISGTANMQAWIDFNDDGSFSSSESIGGTNGVTSSGTTATISIPSSAATGTHILRFSVTAGASYPNINSCPTGSTYSSGETHDYTVVVGTASAPCAAVAGLTVTGISSTSATLGWTTVAGSAGYEYIVDKTASNPTTTGTNATSTSATIGLLTPNTTYYAHVRNKCNAVSRSAWVTKSFTTTTSTGCDTPASISITSTSGTNISASWPTVTGASGYEYLVSQSSSTPTTAGTLVNTGSTTASGLTKGTSYYFHLRTKCGSTYSPWIKKAFKAATTGIEGASTGDYLFAYPNPTTGVLSIELTHMPIGEAAIRITDVKGSLIRTITVLGTHARIELTNAPVGFYFLHYTDAGTSKVLRVQKL